MNDEQQWLELPAGIVKLDGVIWIREPDNVSLGEIAQSFRDGSYAKPFIHDDGEVRRLHFNFDSTQSEMAIDQENALVFDYTKEMMSFMLFNPQPRHVVIIGLGGGSMSKFLYQQLPDSRITTLENDENVIGLAPLFEVPPNDQRHQIIHADAADYFSRQHDPIDVVLIDGCDAEGTAEIFYQEDFYQNLRRSLSDQAIVIVNMVGDKARRPQLKKTLSQCLAGPNLATELDDEKNRLLFAFPAALSRPDWKNIEQRATDLQRQHGLNFADYASKLKSAWPQASRDANTP